MRFYKGSSGRYKGSTKFYISLQRFDKVCSTTVIYGNVLYKKSSQGFVLLVERAVYEFFIKAP